MERHVNDDARLGHDVVVRVLLEYGSDIAARNAKLWTPLDCAAAHGWIRTATNLLDYHAPIDPEDKTGTTPLHLAAKAGHVALVKLLIERGADVNNLDVDSNNALDLAIANGHKYICFSISPLFCA